MQTAGGSGYAFLPPWPASLSVPGLGPLSVVGWPDVCSGLGEEGGPGGLPRDLVSQSSPAEQGGASPCPGI